MAFLALFDKVHRPLPESAVLFRGSNKEMGSLDLTTVATGDIIPLTRPVSTTWSMNTAVFFASPFCFVIRNSLSNISALNAQAISEPRCGSLWCECEVILPHGLVWRVDNVVDQYVPEFSKNRTGERTTMRTVAFVFVSIIEQNE